MKVDLIINNAKGCSYTTDGKKAVFEAVAVGDGKIIAVGSDADVSRKADAATKIIDAQGGTVTAGFCDSHLHASMMAQLQYSAEIFNIVPREDESRDAYTNRVLEKVKKFAAEHPDLDIIRGTGFNPEAFRAVGGMLCAKDLDRVSTEKPVILYSYCQHYICVNSKALEMAGITKDTPLHPSCMVEKDGEGNPTGLFVEISAQTLFLDSFEQADFSVEQYKAGILKFQEEYARSNGVTSYFEAMSRPNAIQAYRELAESGKLKMRVRSCFLADPIKSDEQFDEMIKNKGKYDVEDMFRIDAIKFFFDGGEFTAMMKEPLESDALLKNGFSPDYLGPRLWEKERLQNAFERLAKAGYQIHIHVWGDRAVQEALDLFEAMDNKGIEGRRHTLAHIALIDEADIARMKKYNVVAAMQPQWAEPNSFWELYYIPIYGKERTDRLFPAGDLVKGGVVVSASTDFPIVFAYDLMYNIQVAMTRKVPKSSPEYEMYRDAIFASEDDPVRNCVSLDQMLQCFTAGGAYQLFLEQITGSVEPGKSADLVIFDRDLSAVDEMEMEQVNVKHVIFKGEVL